MASNSKKKLEEKHLKMLRDMAALVHNRECFDCHQRGPTYVNMTVGSFVCTACSGLLRGLNPPHRVKSISMSSFTPEEMEFLVCRGNEFCKRTWTGLHDGRSHGELSSKDEGKMRDFLAQKYEKKRWYVAPTEAMLEEARRMNMPPEQSDPKALKSMNAGVAALSIQNGQSKVTKPLPMPDSSVSRPTGQPVSVRPLSQPQGVAMFASSPPKSQAVPKSATFDLLSNTPAAANVPKSTTIDLLADFGGDPFGSASSAAASSSAAPQSPTGVGFVADFSQFGHPQPAANLFQPSQPAAPTQAAFPSGGLLQPQSKTSVPGQPAHPAPVAQPAAPTDKYSALADLDGLFGSSSGTSLGGGSTGAGLFGGSSGGSVFGSSSTGTSGSVFGGISSVSSTGTLGATGGSSAFGGASASGAYGASAGSSLFGGGGQASSTGVQPSWPGSQSATSSTTNWMSGGAGVGHGGAGGWAGVTPAWSGAVTQPAPQNTWGGGATQWGTGMHQPADSATGLFGQPAASMNPFLSASGPAAAVPGVAGASQFGGIYGGGAVPNGFMPQPPSYASTQAWPSAGQQPAPATASFPATWAAAPGMGQPVRPAGGASTNPFL